MGCCIPVPLVDGRIFTDEDGREFTLLYEEDAYINMEGDSTSEMIDAVVLIDPEEDVIIVPSSIFVERFTEAPSENFSFTFNS